MYQGLEIGSASPSREYRERVPHFLFNYVSFPNELSVGDFYRDYLRQVRQVAFGTPVFVVGGTGFYFRALEKGLLSIPPVPESLVKELEMAVENPSMSEVLYQELIQADPKSSFHIHRNDKYRLVRALSVYRSHGQTPRQFEESHLNVNATGPLLKVGIHYSKEELLPRVRSRVDAMIQDGLIDEVEVLCRKMESQGIDWKKGYRVWKPLKSIGYRETLQHLRGELDRALLKEEIVLQTMKLIKKQRTWFRGDPDIRWFAPSDKEKWIVQVRHFLLEDGV